MTGLLRSEHIKLASLRGTWITALVGVVLSIALVVLSTSLFGNQVGDGPPPDTSVAARLNLVGSALVVIAIVVMVLGVQAYTNEIKSRTILPSVTAAPDRNQLFAAKTVVVALWTLAIGAVVAVLAVVAVKIGLDIKGYELPLDTHELARIAVSLAYVSAVLGVLGYAVGSLVQSAAGGIAILLAWTMAGETLLSSFLPESVSRYLPFMAASAMVDSSAGDLSVLESGGVVAGWTAIALAAGWLVFTRRDLG